MRRTTRASLLLSISVVGLIVAAPGWSVSDDEARQPRDILIEQLQGKVDVSTNDSPRRVEIGNALDLPSRIVTGDDGRILLRQGRTGVDIAPASDVEIPEAAADGQLIGRMIQHRGSVFYDVETRPLEQLRLTVETPYLVAVVKGTQFNVSVVNEATTISLFEGTLEIRTPDGLQSIQLNAGEIAIRSLIDDSIRRLPMDADRFDEIAQADGRQAAEADRPADARATGETSADVAVVDGAVDGTRTAVTTEVSVATEIETSGGTDGTVAKTALQADIRQISSLEVTEYRETTLVETVDLSLDSGIYTNVDLGDIEIDTVLDTTVDLGDTVLDTSLDLSIGDAGTSGGTGSSGGTVVTDDGGLTRLLSPLL